MMWHVRGHASIQIGITTPSSLPPFDTTPKPPSADFIPPFENIEADYDEGTDHEVKLHDGSRIVLHKLGKDYDPTNKAQAINAIHGAIAEGKFLTGLIYYNPNRLDFATEQDLCDVPLSELTQDDLQPPLEALEQINANMMK